MASSFIEFKGNGFWAKDGFAEAFQLLLFEEIDSSFSDTTEWLNDYKRQLALESLPLISGGMSMRFDEMLTDPVRQDLVFSLIENIKQKITANKNYLTASHLNLLRKTVREYLVAVKAADWDNTEIERQVNEDGYTGKLFTGNYMAGFILLQKLVCGQLLYKADSPVTYWND